jgi:hypothetical protein
MRPFALEITAGDSAFAAYRSISLVGGTLYVAAALPWFVPFAYLHKS